MIIAEVEPFVGNLKIQVFNEDKERLLFEKPIEPNEDDEVDLEDDLLQTDVQYFARLFTEANNFRSDFSDFLIDGQLTKFLPFIFAAAGGFMQFEFALKTDTFSTPNTSPTPVTGLSTTVVSTATAKFLIFTLFATGTSLGHNTMSQITCNGSPIAIGDAAGSRQRATAAAISSSVFGMEGLPIIVPDQPGIVGNVTYAINLRSETGLLAFVGRSSADPDTSGVARVASAIMVLQVAE